MKADIKLTVHKFFDQLADKNHRYLSWEHCYRYFHKSNLIVDVDKACLHLSFYLASWGMYRGSSFLLWKDYLIHKEVVTKLISVREQFQDISFSEIDDEVLSEIICLYDWIENWYAENVGLVNGENRNTKPTAVLVTKIMLGTLGCIPAYDRYFDQGLGVHNISPKTVTLKGLRALSNFYNENVEEFLMLQDELKYPAMKLVDMYFWQVGVDSSKI